MDQVRTGESTFGFDVILEELKGAEETVEAAYGALAHMPDCLDHSENCRHLREAAKLIRKVIGDDWD